MTGVFKRDIIRLGKELRVIEDRSEGDFVYRIKVSGDTELSLTDLVRLTRALNNYCVKHRDLFESITGVDISKIH